MTAVTKRVRWECPSGAHPGVLGPSRPRRENIVRYCLPCSQAAGKLVERIAPAVERKRESSAARAAEQRRFAEAKARERERAKLTIAGVHLPSEAQRVIRKAPEFKSLRGREITIQVRRCGEHPRSRLGWAKPWENRICIFDYPGCDAADVRETLVHELTHLVSGLEPGDAHWHGARFHATLRSAFRAAYGITPIGARTNSYHGRYAAALRTTPTN